MIFFTLTGYKGGCGKTTSAIHLAAYFATIGKTLLIDSDPNQSSLKWAKRGELAFKTVSKEEAPPFIADRDFIAIDTSARPKTNDLAELAQKSSLLILPLMPDALNFDVFLQTIADLPPNTLYRALICNVPSYPSKEGQELKQTLVSYDIPVFQHMIRRTTGFQFAAKKGVTIRDLKAKSKVAWNDYKAVGKEILDILGKQS